MGSSQAIPGRYHDIYRGRVLERHRGASVIFTIGHSTHPIAEFLALLREVPVELLVDVRSFPRSRTNPQFNTEALRDSLGAAGVGYRHLLALGGRRRGHGADSPNTLWRNDAFRNYADYAQTEPFRAALRELTTLAARQRCAIMCSEALWWRCHRRIITDYLLAQAVPVTHIMGQGNMDAATLTPGARALPDGTLVYQAAE
jgi:uncharacterized protein (DUF488 family)